MPLKVAAPQPRIERYVRGLAKRFDREPVDSKLLLRNSKPFVTKDSRGRGCARCSPCATSSAA